jgi:phenol hydroxylase P1 protein
MSIEIKTATIEPLRVTFDHLEARLGPGKVPTRYQEGVHDLQAEVNFHYRPTWEPELELHDRRRTRVRMADFDKLTDPRQYYYATYTIQRAKQQDSQEANFDFVEKRGLIAPIPESWRDRIRRVVLPLRHLAWAANTNNCYITAYGFGTPFTAAAMFQTTDALGIAQYITRIGLALDGNDPAGLGRAKAQWLEDPMWQGLRELAEDSMVVRDWFELHVLQNFLIDGAVYPLVFEHFDRAAVAHGGTAFSMLCEFMVDWSAESVRWVDAVIRIAAAESAENAALIAGWLSAWTPRVRAALAPLATEALGDGALAALDAVFQSVRQRAAKCGVA